MLLLLKEVQEPGEPEPMHYLRTNHRHEVVVPGPHVEHKRLLFWDFDKLVATMVVEDVGWPPRFASTGGFRYKDRVMAVRTTACLPSPKI